MAGGFKRNADGTVSRADGGLKSGGSATSKSNWPTKTKPAASGGPRGGLLDRRTPGEKR